MAKLISSPSADNMSVLGSAAARKRQVLEPRVLLDAAAVATALEVLTAKTTDTHTADAHRAHHLADALAPETATRQVIFIDSNVTDYASLLSQAPAGAKVFVIDSGKDGLKQMNDILASLGHKVDAISIVSHGAEAALQVGSDVITEANLASYAKALETLGSHLNKGGDLLLYGCDIAEGQDGHDFVNHIAQLTGADVAASTDVTGIDGNWTLEMTTGSIETHPWDALHTLHTDLALNLTNVGIQTGTSDLGTYMDGAGNFVAAGEANGGKVIVYSVDGNSQPSQTISTTAGIAGGFTTTSTSAIGGTTITWSTHFGEGVAMSYNSATQVATLAVADPNATTSGGTARGAIAIFQGFLDSTGTMSWVFRQAIDVGQVAGIGSGSIGPATGLSGYSTQYMAIAGNHLVVGTPTEGGNTGMVVAFSDDAGGGTWSGAIGSYAFNEPSGYSNSSSPLFGASVAISQDYFVVGAPGADTVDDDGYGGADTKNQGMVVIYQWTQGTSATAANVVQGGGGAPTADTSGVSGAQSAGVLFGNPDADGSINGNGGAKNGGGFGRSVAIDYYNGAYTIAASSINEGAGGELYVYQTTSSSMSTLSSAVNIYGIGGTQFGSGAYANEKNGVGTSLKVSQNRIVLGASDNGTVSGFYMAAQNGAWATMAAGAAKNTFNPGADSGGAIVALAIGNQSEGTNAGFGAALMNGDVVALGAPASSKVGFYYIYTPVAVTDRQSITQDATLSFNPLDNDVFGSVTKNYDSSHLSFDYADATGSGTWAWNSGTNQLTFTPNAGAYDYLAQGSHAAAQITYTLTYAGEGQDGNAMTTKATVYLTINGTNDAPVVGIGVPNVDKPLSIDGVASTGSVSIPATAFTDVDVGDTLTYSISAITPVGSAPAAPGTFLTLSGSTINYNLAGMTANTQYTVTVQATDNHGASVTTTFVFTVDRADHTPTNSPVPLQNATEKSPFTLDVTPYYSDVDTPETLTYTIVGETGPGAAWLSITSGGKLVGTPGNDNDTLWGGVNGGQTWVTVRATDMFGQYVDNVVKISVANVNDAPSVDHAIGQVVAEKGSGATTFSFNVVTGAMGGTESPSGGPGPYFKDIDPTGDTMTYTAYVLDGNGNRLGQVTSSSVTGYPSGVGSWLRFDGTTFTGTPTDVLDTVFGVELVATDNHNAATSTTFTVGEFAHAGIVANNGGPAAADGGLRGYSSTLSDNGQWAAYGEPGQNRVLIYQNAGGTWTYKSAVTGTAGSNFGASVSLSSDGSKLVVGAPEGNGGTGLITYYTVNTTTGVATAANTVNGATAGSRFGFSVSVSDDGTKVVVGAPKDTVNGKAYQYAWNGTAATTTFVPVVDAGDVTGGGGDMYGWSVSLSNNMLAIGAPRDDINGHVDAGSVYVYTPSSATLVHRYIREDVYGTTGYSEQDATQFGRSVSVDDVSGNFLLAIGAPGDDGMKNPTSNSYFTDAGAVYMYTGSSSNVTYQATVFAYDGQPSRNFGMAVAVDIDSSGTMRLAAGGDFNAGEPGTLYVYRYYAGNGWLGQRFDASTTDTPNPANNDLGYSVGIAGVYAIAGAPYAETSGGNVSAGLVYHVNLTGTTVENALMSGQVVKGEMAPPSDGGSIIYQGGGQPTADSMAVQHLLQDDLDARHIERTAASYLTADITSGHVTGRAAGHAVNPLLYQLLINQPVSQVFAFRDGDGHKDGKDKAHRSDKSAAHKSGAKDAKAGKAGAEKSAAGQGTQHDKMLIDGKQPAPNAATDKHQGTPDAAAPVPHAQDSKSDMGGMRSSFQEQIQRHSQQRDHDALQLLDSLKSLVA